MPFGVRMAIGTTAVVATLMGAGVAAATLVPETPATPLGAAATPTAPAADEPLGEVRLLDPPAAAHGRATAPGASPTAVPHRPAPRRSVTTGPASRTSPSPGAAARRPGAHRPAPQRSTPHRSGGRQPGPARPGAVPPGRPPADRPATAPVGVRPTPTRVPSSAVPSASTEPSSSASATVDETLPIPFPTRWIEDRSMRRGTQKVQTAGEPGIRTRTYVVTTVDGRETGRQLVSDRVTKKPVSRVVAIGTRRGSCRPGHDGCPGPDQRCPDGSAAVSVYLLGDDIVTIDRDGCPRDTA